MGSFLAASAPNPSFGQVVPCWAQLELLGSQRGSYLCLTCAQRAQPRPSSSATWIQVVPLWEQLWPKSVRSTWRAQCEGCMHILSDIFYGFWPRLGNLPHVGFALGSTWPGSSHVAQMFARSDGIGRVFHIKYTFKLPPGGSFLGASSLVLVDLSWLDVAQVSRFCSDMKNAQIITLELFFRDALFRGGNAWPPQLKLWHRFVDSFFPTLNYHAPAPSVRADFKELSPHAVVLPRP